MWLGACRGETNAREVPGCRPVLEEPQPPEGQEREVKVSISVYVNRRGGSSVMVVVQTEDIGALDESLIRSAGVVKQAVPLESAEGPPETDRLLSEDVFEGLLLFDRLGVGDNLSPEERSKIRRFLIPVAGVTVSDEDFLVTVVVQVIKGTGPGPPSIIDPQLNAAVVPPSGTGTPTEQLIAPGKHFETSVHVVANRLGEPNDAMAGGVHVRQIDAPLAGVVPVGDRDSHGVVRVAKTG